VLKKIGVSTSDAITMFLRQVVMRQHAPDIAEDRVEPLPDLGEAA
jgi:antitoxin component of RelBE/YafQ-DinJ toxin-antitoxin module